jgi:uncharacterized RDD family membrane protein YckC
MYLEPKREIIRVPKAPVGRRIGAFAADFMAVWIISVPFTGAGWLQGLVFCFSWIILRVILPANNRGQSPGRWLFDLKVLEARANRIPTLLNLMQRESVAGLAALLLAAGLGIGLTNGITLVMCITPLMVDGAIAFGDSDYRQAGHDRLAATIIAQTQRGFSLDLRIKKFVAKMRRSMRQ